MKILCEEIDRMNYILTTFNQANKALSLDAVVGYEQISACALASSVQSAIAELQRVSEYVKSKEEDEASLARRNAQIDINNAYRQLSDLENKARNLLYGCSQVNTVLEKLQQECDDIL